MYQSWIYIYIYIYEIVDINKCERIFSSKYEKLTILHLNFQHLWSLNTQEI